MQCFGTKIGPFITDFISVTHSMKYILHKSSQYPEYDHGYDQVSRGSNVEERTTRIIQPTA